MAIRELEGRAVEKVWGRRDVPAIYGDASRCTGPVGEIWFEDPAAATLLVKCLFTSEKLSIQVHPDDELARANGHLRGKEEAWYVLAAEPGAVIGAGFAAEMTAAELRAAAVDGSIEALMTWHRVKPGDFFHVPAGTVHAIGAGLSLLEIQQNVDLTYRLFDYGRPRPLQLDEATAASVARPFEQPPVQNLGDGRAVLVESPKFAIERLSGPSVHRIGASETAQAWLMPVSGDCSADGTGLASGTVWLTDAPTDIRLEGGGCLLVARAGPALT